MLVRNKQRTLSIVQLFVFFAILGYYCDDCIIIGVFTGIVFNFDPRLSLLAGDAGTDILEGIYKSFKTEKVMVVSSKK